MATSPNILCGLCEAQHITKYADLWCFECDKGLCSDCEHNFHRISKANHGAISIDNYHKLPSSSPESGNHCECHDIMKCTLFCQHHDKPCCPDCISTNHKDCVGLLSIGEIINISDPSTLIDNIEKHLTDFKNNIDTITKSRQENLSEIRQQRQMFQDQIKLMRVRINSHLDTLEQNILQELDETVDKIESKVDNLLKQLSKISKTVDRLQFNIIAVKEYVSDLQIFLGSKVIEEEVKKEEEYLNALSEDGCLQLQFNPGCNINTKIKDILSTITFGSVSMETSLSSGVVVKTTKVKQAQIMSVIQYPSVKSINDIKLTLHTTFDIKQRNGDMAITGCIVCPNSKMIFVDYHYKNQRLVILNEDGTLNKEITCSLGRTGDVTLIDDTTVAVSTSHGIEIINIDSTKTERCIRTSELCGGITHHNGVLLWCGTFRGIQMMRLSDDRVTTLCQEIRLPHFSYITSSGDKIYQPNYYTNTVTCYTINGKTLWEYKDESVLKNPHGVTVDNNSNVYVTSYTSHTVVVIAPDGRQGRQLIRSGDGSKSPYAIYFDKAKNNLLVTTWSGPAFLYHMC